jgi:hypothetical protein
VSKEELSRGGVVKLTHIVTLDTHNLTTKLSANKRKELGDSQKGVRLPTQRRSPTVVWKIIKNDKIVFRAWDANNRRCSKIAMD